MHVCFDCRCLLLMEINLPSVCHHTKETLCVERCELDLSTFAAYFPPLCETTERQRPQEGDVAPRRYSHPAGCCRPASLRPHMPIPPPALPLICSLRRRMPEFQEKTSISQHISQYRHRSLVRCVGIPGLCWARQSPSHCAPEARLRAPWPP